MEQKFSAKFNKKGKDLYNFSLEAILNVGYRIESEDNKKLIIQAKTGMSMLSFGQNLDIQIKGSNIILTTRTKSVQVTDWGEGEKISKDLFDEIKNISKSVKKTKRIKKEIIEKHISKTKEYDAKKSSQSKMEKLGL